MNARRGGRVDIFLYNNKKERRGDTFFQMRHLQQQKKKHGSLLQWRRQQFILQYCFFCFLVAMIQNNKRSFYCQAFSSLEWKLATTTTTITNIRRIRYDTVAPLHQQSQQQQEDTAAVLTDLDARVLQEMLLDSQKLDLQETENMKSLLERGIKAKENPTTTTTTKEQSKQSKKSSSSPFQSEALQALGSTKLWKAFERKAEDWIESAKLY
eukprot:scaffold16346_cov49-Cylindrotheca_fusiformis.AAC.1